MRADFGKGGEQVQESGSWQSNTGRVYQERHDVFGQAHANSAGLIGGSRRATDVWLHSDSPLLKQPFPVCSTGSYSARTNSVTPLNRYMFAS
jgi:hypothetical protein